MKTPRLILVLLSALCSTMLGAEISSAEYTDDSQKTIRFTVDGKEVEIAAPKGKFWDDLIVCENKKDAFFVLNRGDRKDGSWIEDLHRFSAGGSTSPTPILVKTELKEAKILNIYNATADGARLLIELHYSHKKDAKTTYYRTYPYFLDTRDGTITPVKP